MKMYISACHSRVSINLNYRQSLEISMVHGTVRDFNFASKDTSTHVSFSSRSKNLYGCLSDLQ